MMQVARRTLLVAVLILLASVGTAYAECAWVLWIKSGSEWRIIDAFTGLGGRSFMAQSKCERAAKEARVEGERFEFFCLPDTIDPRGPKGK